MIDKKYIYALLGEPIVKIEITDEQFDIIVKGVKDLVQAYKKLWGLVVSNTNKPQSFYDTYIPILEEEGVLAHVKYATGRIRGKYTQVPTPSSNLYSITDGKELAHEAWLEIQAWKKKLERLI